MLAASLFLPGQALTAAVWAAADGSSAGSPEASFALADIQRANSGTARSYQGVDYGYRYPQANAQSFVVLVLSNTQAIVYLPAAKAAELGIDITDKSQQQAFLAQLKAADARLGNGGLSLAAMQPDCSFGFEPQVTIGQTVYSFGQEVEPGYYYTTIKATQKPGEDGRTPVAASTATPALFCLSGNLVASGQVAAPRPPSFLEQVQAFFISMDYRPFWVSLRTSLVALLFTFVFGLAAALLTVRSSSRLKAVLDSVFTIPMVLPPTVCGFLLLVAFGNSTAFGRWLLEHNIQLIFSWPAAVLAATVVAFPLMYRTARGAFEALDEDLLDAARSLGWGTWRIFFRLMLPLSWPSVAAGAVLAFARAMGEFGATLFVAGNYAGVTQTIPIAIYFQWMGGHSDVAVFWVFVVVLISFVVILFINWYAAHVQRYRRPLRKKDTNGKVAK
ncbi:MAG: molybdate ABC transporter permease subunit [Actinomycetia bacterium]|nr:molybdate ABC transporter permease subunit [Actinomycetes bacterium]